MDQRAVSGIGLAVVLGGAVVLAWGLHALTGPAAPQPGESEAPDPDAFPVGGQTEGPVTALPAPEFAGGGGGGVDGTGGAAGTKWDPTRLVGPDGQPLPPGSAIPGAGLPERGAPQPPLGDAEAWREVRADAARAWRDESLRIAAEFAAEQGLSVSERESVLAILAEMHAALEASRAAVEAGTATPAEGRAEREAARESAEARLRETLGAERTEALRAVLSAQTGGGF